MITVTVGYESLALRATAEQIAQRLQLPLDNHHFPRLSVTDDKLVLLFEQFSPLYADFNPKRWQHRFDSGKKQGLVQACKPSKGMKIVDATAGWGRDAAVLASFGAHVVMLEKNPVMAELLRDALHRRYSSQDTPTHEQISPSSGLGLGPTDITKPSPSLDDSQINATTAPHHALSLQCIDAKRYLQNLAVSDYPDVIYLDPMHPTRQKSALVKKEMQVLQELVAYDEDVLALLQLAMSKATQRVVVKWPQRQPPLMPPKRSISGKTVRFDIF